MTSLLFLIADTGGGHRASANAVMRHLRDVTPGDFDVRIVDPFADASPHLVARTAGLYGPITRHAAWSWGALYHVTNSRAAVAALHHTVLRSVRKGVQHLIAETNPDAVVSFHPLLNHVAVDAVRQSSRRVPVITVITDLVDVHAAWASAEVDAVVIPSLGGLDRCRRAGIPARRCFDLGLPVDPSFTAALPTPTERSELRQRLGLDANRFVVLICGGADGSGGIARRARALAAAALDVEVVVICGRNQRARRHLAGLRDWRGRPVPVHGFVRNMAEWMRAADVIATKAGPGTIAEALCCGVPLLLTCYIPGQERGNVEWVSDIGAGRFVPRPDQLVDTVAELAEPASPALAAMRAVVQRVARPDATARIAALIAALAGGAPEVRVVSAPPA